MVAISHKTGADADAGQPVRVSPMRDRPRESESAYYEVAQPATLSRTSGILQLEME